MFAKIKNKKTISQWRLPLILWGKRLLFVLIAFAFTYIFLELGSDNKVILQTPEAPKFTQEIASIPLEEGSKPNYTPITNNILAEEKIFGSSNDKVNIVETGKLDLELIASTMAENQPSSETQKITALADQAIVTVFPNSAGILEDPDAIEATYEEDLPEGEYVEEHELTPEQEAEAREKGYHIYRGHKNLRDIEIDISHKPPYFPVPLIAIVIDDMGVSPLRTKDIIALQAPITSSFLTYSRNIPTQVAAARKSGHEIMIHIPMQAKSNVDAAPDVLTIDMDEAQISDNFNEMLTKFSEIKGINNHMGSLFTEHAEKLAPIMTILKAHNLFFLDSKTSAKSAGRKSAAAAGVPYVHRQVFLDNENNVEYIRKQLELTEKIAQRNGYAIAIGHPKSGTYLALKQWLPELEGKSIKLVPLSEIVKIINPQNQ